MDDLLTIAQIEAQFSSEWVLIEDPTGQRCLGSAKRQGTLAQQGPRRGLSPSRNLAP